MGVRLTPLADLTILNNFSTLVHVCVCTHASTHVYKHNAQYMVCMYLHIHTCSHAYTHIHTHSCTNRNINPFQKEAESGLPSWHSGWESAHQVRGHRFNPWSGKIPHGPEQLSLWATTTEPACCNYWIPSTLEPVLWNKRSHCNEKLMPHNSRVAPTHCNWRKTLQQQRPSGAKNKISK